LNKLEVGFQTVGGVATALVIQV